MSKMKILIVTQHFWPEVFPINEIAKSLIDLGHIVEVLTACPNYPEGQAFPGYKAFDIKSEVWAGIKIFRVPLVTRGKHRALRRIVNYLSFVISGSVFSPWLLRKKKYDAVFVYAVSPIFQAIPAIFISWLKKCRTVVWVQDLWPESLSAMGVVRNEKILWSIGLIVRWIYRHTDLILTQSEAFIAPVKALAPGSKIIYYPNSVATFFSEPVKITEPLEVKFLQGFSVLFAGNIGVGQAVEVITDAATLLKEYTDIHFVLIGQGSRWQWMKDQVEARNLTNVHLLGRFPVETMPSFMQKASALLVTLADEPIFAQTVPNKVQAYLASGRPILASLNGEGARIVTQANAGIATPASDAKALADAVLKLYKMNETDRAALGQNGKAYFKQHFDHAKLMQDLVTHLQQF